MTPTYDVAVAGLGAVGSAAAYHAARRGRSVVGFDRFRPPHTRGSTHGGSRIIRRAYFEGDVFLPLLERAYACWRMLEEDGGGELLHLRGVLTIGPGDGRVFAGASSSARAFDVPHEVLDPADVADRFPAFRLGDGERAVFEPEAGWIDPEAAVRAHLDGARRRGAELRYGEPVLSWRAEDGGVRIETPHGRVSAGAMIVCSGGWITSLLPGLALPLVLERQVNVWYHPAARAMDLQPPRCPAFVWAYQEDRVLYGFPDLGHGVKAGLHHTGAGARRPEELDRHVHPDDVERLSDRLRRLLPDAPGRVARTATCFYTNTPDERFVIDVHPGHASVVFASACSGHGFKTSSAVGENLALLACGEEPSVDLRPYRAARYPS